MQHLTGTYLLYTQPMQVGSSLDIPQPQAHARRPCDSNGLPYTATPRTTGRLDSHFELRSTKVKRLWNAQEAA
jgi:hypothetical protein